MTPYKPRELSKIDASIFRELISSKRTLAVFPKNPSKKIRFFEANAAPKIEEQFSFSFQIAHQKVDLVLELKTETPLFKRLEEVGGFESVPEEFQVALMTFASEEIIDALTSLFQLPVTLWKTSHDQEIVSEKRELCFEIIDAQTLCEARAKIVLSTTLVERIIAVAQQVPMANHHSLGAVVLKGDIFIGSALLTIEEGALLHPGDLIVLQDPSSLTTGQGAFFMKESGEIPLSINPDLIKTLVLPIEQVFPNGIVPALSSIEKTSEKEAVPEKRESEKSLITLELHFSAGLLSLTMEEVLQLAKGKVPEQPLQLVHPLKIFVQGELAGAGELVEIGGRLALAVTQLTHNMTTQ